MANREITRLDREMTEKQFQDSVIELAETMGYTHFHAWSMYRSDTGYPDLTLAKPGMPLIIAELKREGKEPTDKQRTWLELLG